MCPLKAGGPRQLPAPPAAAAARAAACAAASSSAHSNSSGMVAPPHGLKSTIFTRRDAVTCTSYTSAKPKPPSKRRGVAQNAHHRAYILETPSQGRAALESAGSESAQLDAPELCVSLGWG